MADASEDIPSAPHDTDLSDETQDFRFLSSLSSYEYDGSQTSTLPRRGEKDFEPNPTLAQANVLESARQAMHSAISYPRLHVPKNHVVGTWDPDSGTTIVSKPRGQWMHTLGTQDRWNRISLLPEEALYLLERGSLDVRWPRDQVDGDGDGDVPMSLQGAYAVMMGRDGLTMERYAVFAGLKRIGYTIQRAPTWAEDGVPTRYGHDRIAPSLSNSWALFGFIPYLLKGLFSSKSHHGCPSFGPLVAPGLYRNYSDIYRALAIIPRHNPSLPPTPTSPTEGSPYRITFHVWKPTTPFRKSSPPIPDFHISVLDARNTTTPTVTELSDLLGCTPFAPPRDGGHFYGRLKHGWRNVILAVVDQGVVSYLRVSEAGFGEIRLYDQRPPRSSKSGRGGRGGRRGGRGGRGGR